MHVGIKLDEKRCGWVCTNDDFSVLQLNGQELIGSHTYQVAELAENRRISRSQKRNRERTRERIAFLNNAFAEELKKIDENFLTLFEESELKKEDKSIRGSFDLAMFGYPTISHAIKAVKDGDETDLRVIYAVVRYFFNKRGNFNTKASASTGGSQNDLSDIYRNLRNCAREFNFELPADADSKTQLESLLISKADKRERLEELKVFFGDGTASDKEAAALANLLMGYSVDMMLFFQNLSELEKDERKMKFSDASREWEDVIAGIEPYLEQKELLFLRACREMYDWCQLKKVLGEHKCFTDAKIDMYDKHKSDLKELKELCKEIRDAGYDNKFYHKMFYQKEPENKKDFFANYRCYVGRGYDEKNHATISCEKEDFYKYMELTLRPIAEAGICVEKIERVLDDIAQGTYMPKSKSKDNRLIPNAYLAAELKDILNTASMKYGFFNKKGISGELSVKEELLQMFSFCLPYWVGPLDDEKFGWCVRKEQGTIYPWNISQKLDFAKTRKNFIRNITNDCKYLVGQKVLPSISYSNLKALCLNELNGIMVDGRKLSIWEKQHIFDDLLMAYPKVTQLNIEKYLQEHNCIDSSQHEFTGLTQKKMIHTMAPFLKALEVVPNISIEDYNAIAMAVSVCKDDTALMYDICRNDTSLNDEEIRLVIGAVKIPSTNPWAEHSEAFLSEITGKEKGEGKQAKTILETLYETDKRISEIIGSGYTFNEQINSYNDANAADTSIETFIETLNTPPYIKRELFRMKKVLEDIKAYTTQEPETLSINVYVPNNFKARKINVKNTIKKGLEKASSQDFSKTVLRKNGAEWAVTKSKSLLKCLKNEDADSFTKRKILWYLQMGKDIYTGEDIPYEELSREGNLWTIDHIYPKSKVYDEELMSNLVLTNKGVNEEKTNAFPIDKTIQSEMEPFWKILLKAGLMTQKKYDALTCTVGIPLEKKLETIDKLLIERRKTAFFGAARVIHHVFPSTQILFVGNERLRQFKTKFGLEFSEIINYSDYAKEALCTTIVGRVWDDVFTKNPKRYIIDNPKYSLNIWNYDSNLYKAADGISKINIENHKFLITRMPMCNTSGMFANDTVYSAKNLQNVKCDVMPKSITHPQTNDVYKYGGRKSLNVAYLTVVEHTVKKQRTISLVPVYIYQAEEIKSKDDLVRIFSKRGYKDVAILDEKLMLYSYAVIGEYVYQLRGLSGNSVILTNGEPAYVPRAAEFEKVFRANRVSTKRFDAFAAKEDITDEFLEVLYDTFVEYYRNNYAKRIRNCIPALLETRQDFVKLSMADKCKFVENLFGLTKTAPSSSLDMSVFKGPKAAGTISCVNCFDSIEIVNKSATGLFTTKKLYAVSS